jgi:hypothetical protein
VLKLRGGLFQRWWGVLVLKLRSRLLQQQRRWVLLELRGRKVFWERRIHLHCLPRWPLQRRCGRRVLRVPCWVACCLWRFTLLL